MVVAEVVAVVVEAVGKGVKGRKNKRADERKKGDRHASISTHKTIDKIVKIDKHTK